MFNRSRSMNDWTFQKTLCFSSFCTLNKNCCNLQMRTLIRLNLKCLLGVYRQISTSNPDPLPDHHLSRFFADKNEPFWWNSGPFGRKVGHLLKKRTIFTIIWPFSKKWTFLVKKWTFCLKVDLFLQVMGSSEPAEPRCLQAWNFEQIW